MSRDSEPPNRLRYVADRPAREGEFRRALERRFDVSVVGGVEAALDRVDAGVECVVVSHGGSVDGVAAVEAVREHHPDLPVVLLGPDDGRLAGRAVAADVSGYVPRTTADAPGVLVERVRSAVDDLTRRGKGREEGRAEEASERPDDGASELPIEELGLRERLRLKERAMEEAPVGITISDPDRPDNPLIYANDAFRELTGYTKGEAVGRNCRFLQGEGSDPNAVAALRDAIDRDEQASVELVNYRKGGEPFWNVVDVAPIRGEDGGTTNYVGFQTDVTARKRAEFELERERRRLDHLLDRINGLLQDVHGDLVRATSREGVERAVCERIAAADAYEFCWIGVPDLSLDAIVAGAMAGSWTPDAAELRLDLAAESHDASPVIDAYRSERIRVVDDEDELAAFVENTPWFEAGDLAGMAAIPLVYRETVYGVLVVYTIEADALDERETVVLEALGRATATAINALERERIIVADTVTELEFEVRDRDLLFVDLSARHGAAVEYEGSIRRTDGSMLMFFTTDADPALVDATAEDHPDVEAVTLVAEHPDGNLFEFTVGTGSVVTLLAERGARIRSMRAADGTGHISVELPADADTRHVVALLQERYPDVELVAYRERERPPETRQEFFGRLRDDLTERQLTALQTAHVGGFYEPNRPVSGDELAESMGIGRSTYHQHLRAAERKLVAALFER